MRILDHILIDEDGLESEANAAGRRAAMVPLGGQQKASFGWQEDTFIRLDQLIPAILEAQQRIPEELRAEARVKLGYDPAEIVIVYPREETEAEMAERINYATERRERLRAAGINLIY